MSNGMPPETLTHASPQRRQNSSCDPCRRSKRRCTFPLVMLDSSNPACTHCQRLGHTCTFNFATSRLSKKASRKQRKRPDTSDHIASHYDIPSRTGDFGSLDGGDLFEQWLNIDNDSSYNDAESSNQNYHTGDFISGPEYASTDGYQSGNQTTLASNHLRKERSVLPLSARSLSLLGVSRRSPIYLLNSKLDATILDARLARIFNIIVDGCASRYLDYNCNLYATQNRYQIEDSTTSTSSASPESEVALAESGGDLIPSDSPRQSNASSIPPQLNAGRLSSTSADQGDAYNITLIGSARFLDHLAGLYGNKLELAARNQSDAALYAVLRVFALQWIPLPQPSSDTRPPSDRDSCLETYINAWFNARSQIMASQHIRSFRVVLAILLFDGTAIPMKAHASLGFTGIEHEFLDIGLQTLSTLDKLVMQYCATLGPFSRYAALAEASLSLVRWCGYIRDLGAALTASHECKLPAILARGKVQPVYHDLDSKDHSICHGATVRSFCIWRQIIDVRGALQKLDHMTSGIPNKTSEAIHEVVKAVQDFHDTYQPFMQDCTKSFESLSLARKVSIASMISFWSLGVLVLADSLLPFIEDINQFCDSSIFPQLQLCRQVAVSSMTHIIQAVSALPNEAGFNIQNSLGSETPIIAYHVTPSLMTSALAKAVEHSIDLHVMNAYSLEDPIVETNFLGYDDAGNGRIDALIKALLSLDVSIGGSQTAGVAFQSLMETYGDIISEYWSCDGR
ncbi:uncharacterized protein N7484_009430 [Penicillium longicatenatum]|uniref:uncharacterized protein n=1 Tax=Penicillium longicatenatum TaxID=1561947 RepID=UPI0025487223|nr:uncharacterized protein N7484_009430 [Penicillium longicatenatum]KAJ5636117.1 hypothetical protein N7484_009430 [Penicillium longicatenatum]